MIKKRKSRKYRADGKCAKCGEDREGRRGYCRSCHNQYVRLTRKPHRELSPEQRLRANARAYAKVYLKRGKIIKGSCICCGGTDSLEMHHDDYSKPLEIKWLCREHHKMLHTFD